MRQYNSYCYRCHGQDVTGSEIAPDLRHSINGGMTQQEFLAVAMAGRPAKGMPSWAGFFTEEQITQIYQYVKGRSLDLVPVGRPESNADRSILLDAIHQDLGPGKLRTNTVEFLFEERELKHFHSS